MKVDRWFSVLAFGAASCLATPGSDGSAHKDDSQAHEPGAGTDESELSFVAGLTCIGQRRVRATLVLPISDGAMRRGRNLSDPAQDLRAERCARVRMRWAHACRTNAPRPSRARA